MRVFRDEISYLKKLNSHCKIFILAYNNNREYAKGVSSPIHNLANKNSELKPEDNIVESYNKQELGSKAMFNSKSLV